jgi:hypothetical protein
VTVNTNAGVVESDAVSDEVSQFVLDGPKQPGLQFYPKTRFANKLRQFNIRRYPRDR